MRQRSEYTEYGRRQVPPVQFQVWALLPAPCRGSHAEHLARKYAMSVEQAEQLDQQMTERAAAEGLDFNFDVMRGGNTFDAHRLLHLAKERGLQVEMKERLMHAALYVAFPKHQPGATHSDIVVTASHDRGRTWSKPVTATPDDGVTYFQPNLAVDEMGRVAISAFALANGRVDEILLLSRPRELRFRPPLRVSTAPFDPYDPTTASRGKYGAWWIGDWQGIASSAGALHLVWNDTRTGKLDLFAATVRP